MQINKFLSIIHTFIKVVYEKIDYEYGKTSWVNIKTYLFV